MRYLACFVILMAFIAAPSPSRAQTDQTSAPTSDVQGNNKDAFKQPANICDYVANEINHGQLDKITATEGTVTNNGKPVTFVVGWEGGSCGGKEIREKGFETPDTDRHALDGLYFADADCDSGSDNLFIVPFQGKYYTLADSNYQVFAPQTGPVCNFSKHFQLVLTISRKPELCSRYLNGGLQSYAGWTEIKKDALPHDSFGEYWSAKVSLHDHNDMDFIKHHQLLPGGRGADETDLEIIQSDGQPLGDKEPNKTLAKGQDLLEPWNRNSDLLQDGHDTFVEVTGTSLNNEYQSQILLDMEDDAFTPICRIDRMPVVEPVKADDDSSGGKR